MSCKKAPTKKNAADNAPSASGATVASTATAAAVTIPPCNTDKALDYVIGFLTFFGLQNHLNKYLENKIYNRFYVCFFFLSRKMASGRRKMLKRMTRRVAYQAMRDRKG
jgi:hypothetical protein